MVNVDKSTYRREYLLLAAGGVAATAGCSGSGDSDEEPTADTESSETDTVTGTASDGESETEPSEVTTVEADGSIQAAVDATASAGRVELPSATFEESVTVEKALELTAPDGATLDGSNVTEGPAITVSSDDVRLSGMEITGYEDGGVQTTTAVSGFVVDGVSFSNNATALSGPVSDAELLSVSASETGGNAIDLEPTSDGTVTVTEPTVELVGGTGIRIAGGKTVDVTKPDVRQSEDYGIRITGGDTRDQTVTVTGGSTLENDRHGLSVSGTDGTDEITVDGLEAADNGDGGIFADGDTLTVTGVTATDNGAADAGVMLRGSNSGDVTVRDTTVERTVRDFTEGRGLSITDGKTVTVENVTLTDNGGWNLRVDTETVRGQTVEVSDSSAIGNSAGVSISITGSEGSDDVVIENTTAEDADDGGMSITADAVTVTDCAARDNGPADAGINIVSTAEGSVTVTGTTVARTVRDFTEGRGLSITDGKTVTVENVTLTNNGGWNLRIDSEFVRGRTAELVGVEADGNDVGSGISITGTGGDDSVTVRDTTSNNHDEFGYSLGGESVTIENSSASANGAGSLELLDITRAEAEITGSSL